MQLEQFSFPEFAAQAQHNPYVLGIQDNELTPYQVNDWLFREKGSVATDSKKLGLVEEAIVVNNIGLAVIEAAEVYRNMRVFFEDFRPSLLEGSSALVNVRDIFSSALEGVWQSARTYDPARGRGFYSYAKLQIRNKIYWHTIIPTSMEVPDQIKEYILSHYLWARHAVKAELGEKTKRISYKELILAKLMEEGVFPDWLNKYRDSMESAFNALTSGEISLDHLQARARAQQSAMGEEDWVARRSVVQLFNTGDRVVVGPERREEWLLENFDPGSAEWQNSLREVISELGFGFTSEEMGIFLAMYQVVEDATSPNYGKFPTLREIGERLHLSHETIRDRKVKIEEMIMKRLIDGQQEL